MGIFDIFRKTAEQTSSQSPDSENYIDVFRSGNFENATVRQRMEAYQALEHEMAHLQQRPERQVVFHDFEDNLLGQYSPGKDCICLNSEFLRGDCDQFNGMNTVIHEGRHAYQYDCMNGKCNPDAQLRQHLSSMKLEDLPNPNEPGKSVYNKGYYNNPSEYDAHTFANNTMHSFAGDFGQDGNYQQSCFRNDVQFRECMNDLQAQTNGQADIYRSTMDRAQKMLGDEGASADQKMQARDAYLDAENDLKKLTAENYTNGEFDAAKCADSHVENVAKDFGYDDELIEAVKQQSYQPTKAQQDTYDMDWQTIHPENYSQKEDLLNMNSAEEQENQGGIDLQEDNAKNHLAQPDPPELDAQGEQGVGNEQPEVLDYDPPEQKGEAGEQSESPELDAQGKQGVGNEQPEVLDYDPPEQKSEAGEQSESPELDAQGKQGVGNEQPEVLDFDTTEQKGEAGEQSEPPELDAQGKQGVGNEQPEVLDYDAPEQKGEAGEQSESPELDAQGKQGVGNEQPEVLDFDTTEQKGAAQEQPEQQQDAAQLREQTSAQSAGEMPQAEQGNTPEQTAQGMAGEQPEQQQDASQPWEHAESGSIPHYVDADQGDGAQGSHPSSQPSMGTHGPEIENEAPDMVQESAGMSM